MLQGKSFEDYNMPDIKGNPNLKKQRQKNATLWPQSVSCNDFAPRSKQQFCNLHLTAIVGLIGAGGWSEHGQGHSAQLLDSRQAAAAEAACLGQARIQSSPLPPPLSFF